MSKQPSGYVLYAGPSAINNKPIVAVLTLKSSNPKTGDMCQLWILSDEQNPVEASKAGTDASVCGDCPHRGDKGAGRSCYVNLGQAPNKVYTAYKAGKYPIITFDAFESLHNRYVRLGAYGDPAALPLRYIETLAAACKGWTGYTHQWRTIDHMWSKYLMASADTQAQAEQAHAQGWRTFRVTADDSQRTSNEIVCPSVTHGTECRDCRLCAGTSKGAKSIVIESHGVGSKHANTRESLAHIKKTLGAIENLANVLDKSLANMKGAN